MFSPLVLLPKFPRARWHGLNLGDFFGPSLFHHSDLPFPTSPITGNPSHVSSSSQSSSLPKPHFTPPFIPHVAQTPHACPPHHFFFFLQVEHNYPPLLPGLMHGDNAPPASVVSTSPWCQLPSLACSQSQCCSFIAFPTPPGMATADGRCANHSFCSVKACSLQGFGDLNLYIPIQGIYAFLFLILWMIDVLLFFFFSVDYGCGPDGCVDDAVCCSFLFCADVFLDGFVMIDVLIWMLWMI